MARFAGGFKTVGAGTTTLPIASLYATAAVRPVVREIGIVNTSTSTAVDIAIRRATTVGGTHTAREELPETDTTQAAIATLFDTDTGTAPTMTAGNIRATTLIAGAGTIFTFGDRGLVIPNTTGDGIVIVPLGTGQICTIYYVWDE